MRRITRMFEIIQILRASSKPLSAETLGQRLDVSKRTIYRDIGALQGMRIPIDGEAGVGYLMRRGYDLPPLNFDTEEIEALRVGLLMLARTGDNALQKAAGRVMKKIAALQCDDTRYVVAPWGAPPDDPEKGCISLSDVRAAIRDNKKLRITYRSPDQVTSERVIRPIAVIYHLEANMIAAWCEKRGGFRHFRTDRIWECEVLEETFENQADALRLLWEEQEGFNAEYSLARVQ